MSYLQKNLFNLWHKPIKPFLTKVRLHNAHRPYCMKQWALIEELRNTSSSGRLNYA